LTGRRIEADEALRLGVVSRVVPDADLRAEALTVAGEIAAAPREVLVQMKEKILRRSRLRVDRTLDL
jgi:enoyl-CoA hydratase/carnithine racemase